MILIKNVIIVIKKNISNLIVDSKIKNVLINLNQTKNFFVKKFNKTSFTFNFYIELMNIKNFKTKRNYFYCYQKYIAFNCRFENEKRFDEQKSLITFNININIMNINFIDVIVNRLFFKTTKNV